MSSIAKYPVSQPVLYQTGRLIIENLRQNLEAFAAMRGVYNDSFCDLLLEQISQAEVIPNDWARAFEHKALRDELSVAARECRNLQQTLKRYIAAAFPESQFDNNWEAATGNYYDSASNDNWNSISAMTQMGAEYILINHAKLMLNNNMPASFPAAYKTAREIFNAKLTAFEMAQQYSRRQAVIKIEANNACYKAIINVCNDGAVVYIKNETMRELFSFSAASSLVEPTGSSAVVFTAINAATNRPMIVEVIDNTNNRSLTLGNDGTGEMGNLAAGDTVFHFSADGFIAQNIPATLRTGITSRITVRMVPMFTSANVVQPPTVTAPQPQQVFTSTSAGINY